MWKEPHRPPLLLMDIKESISSYTEIAIVQCPVDGRTDGRKFVAGKYRENIICLRVIFLHNGDNINKPQNEGGAL